MGHNLRAGDILIWCRSVDFDRVNRGPLTRRSSPVFSGVLSPRKQSFPR